ncbi:uncharacterized protein LOC101757757 [Setaria italica]|uniref:uncharacterized protein LOC101757757 n=1 Tax=Setaria italica TaxID=4555 RepID=UPI000BE5622F|nr:uncharacterized protein LOC101757757 [Setaria italica]
MEGGKTPAPAAATEEEAVTVTGTSARGATAEVAAAAEVEVPAPEAVTGAGTPALTAATEGEVATGTPPPAPASEAVAPTGGPAAASTGMGRPLFTLDDATEWGKWQALLGGLVNIRVALSSALGELDGVVFPGGQVWSPPPSRSSTTCGGANTRQAEAKFQVIAERARCDREEFQAATEKAHHNAEELARLKGEHEALQKTIERIRREQQKAWQDRDAEKVRKEEAEKVVANLGAEVSQLQVQARELQASVAQGLDRERQLKAQSKGELSRLRELLDVERGEHGDLRDAVRVVCDGLGVVQGEGTSSLVTCVLGTYRRAREIAVVALHTGVRRAFGVFGSHCSGINFAGMSGGYAAGYSKAELDKIDASVLNPAEALVKLLEDEAIPPEDPRTS